MSDPELSPDQEARVRRLLAEARHVVPTPVDVAARLDRVLAGLADEAPAPPVPRGGTVVDLAARRRRRVAGLLVAAAAVVVAGVAIGQVTGVQDDDGDRAGDNTPSLKRGGSSGDNKEGEAQPTGPGDSSVSPSTVPPAVPGGDTPTISTDSFGRDVARLRSQAMTGPNKPGPGYVCEPADWGAGRVVPVFVDGRPAVLVYRPQKGSSQVVDLLQCGTGERLRSTTLPVR